MPNCTASLPASRSPNPHCSTLHLRFGSIGATKSTAHLDPKMSNLFLADPLLQVSCCHALMTRGCRRVSGRLRSRATHPDIVKKHLAGSGTAPDTEGHGLDGGQIDAVKFAERNQPFGPLEDQGGRRIRVLH